MNKPLLYILLMLMLTTVYSHASYLQSPESGQAINMVTGDDGAIQAGKPCPAPRFVNNHSGTIIDNKTGLIWTGDANPHFATVSGNNGDTTWQQALDAIKRLNAEDYLGYSDWRLPNLNELASLVHPGEPVQSLWLSSHGFLNTSSVRYWSSSSFTRDATRAWAVHMSSGSVGALPKNESALFWPVRGVSNRLPATGQSVCYDNDGMQTPCAATGQDGELRMGTSWSAFRYADNNNGTVTDTLTGLVWPKDANPAIDAQIAHASGDSSLWADAIEFVANLNNNSYLGYNDWRLPNRNELVSLINYSETTPGVQLNMAGINDIRNQYWSSSSSAADPSYAWNVTMDGEVFELNKYDVRLGSHIWPVRGGIGATPEITQSSATAVKDLAVAAAAALSITTASLPAGTVETAYSRTLAATSGKTAYSWSITSGTLPAELSLDSSTGIVSGTPTTGSNNPVTFPVKDSNNITVAKSLTLPIITAPAVTAVTPSQNAVDVTINSVSATFNAALDPATITNGSFTVSRKANLSWIAAGYNHTVALKNDGMVAAWGNNGYGQTTVPGDLSGVVAIAAGASHTVALKNDGTVVAWGDNEYGQTEVPTDLSEVIAVAAGGTHTVALKSDGSVVAWGSNNSGPSMVPFGLSGVVSIGAGDYHSVALKDNGTVVAWGGNGYGQTTVPADLSEVVAVAAGGAHTVALKGDGTVVAWGNNGYGQTTVPTDLSDVVAIVAGAYHTVALKGDGTVAAWGYNENRQTDIPAGLSGVIAISAGYDFTLALKSDGTVIAWGNNGYGQITIPAAISGMVTVAAGGDHTVSLKSDGTVAAWGYNEYGQTDIPAGLSGVIAISAGYDFTVTLKSDGTVIAWGNDSLGQTDIPTGLSGVVAVAAGDSHAVALNDVGTVVAWGNNDYGQATVPIGLSGVIAVAAGDYHTVALKSDGTVVVWGNDDFGQATVPSGLSGVVAVAAGASHSVALKGDGTVIAWGNNEDGQSTVPSELSGVVAVTAGDYHSVALKSDGTVVAWGYDEYGQTDIPAELSGVVAVAAGGYHTVALKGDGTVVIWGYNDSGQATVTVSPYETTLPGMVTWDPATLTATFVPDTPLPAGAMIKAFLSQGIKDQVGIRLSTDVTWNFSTATLPLVITTAALPEGTVDFIYNRSLKATGGIPPYSWSISSGALPSGLRLNSSTGVISGIPAVDFNSSITIGLTDSSNNTVTKTLSITINHAPLSIITNALADGYIGSSYSQQVAIFGGKPPHTWLMASGALPAGLSLNSSTGIISGTPTASGSSSFTVQVKDANNTTITKPLEMSAYTLPSITTASLPLGYTGLAYSQTLAANGGKPPYSWSSTYLPLFGLALDSSSGIISGTPTTPTILLLGVHVMDANNVSAGKTFGLVVNAPPAITTATLPEGVAGTAYNQSLAQNNGMPPFSWSVIGGALPAGLSLNSSTGVISGTPTTAGIGTFTVQLLDASNFTASKTLAITVNPPLTITTPTLTDGHAGIAYSQSLEGSGGKAPFSWSVAGGSLPAGLTLSTTGVISGIPITTGSTGFTVQAKDANNFTDSKTFTITLTDAGSIGGTITDRDSGAPLQGVTVTLNLTGIASKDPADRVYSCNAIPLTAPDYTAVTSNDGARFACSTPASIGQSTIFKVRNPFGSADSFSMKWTGTSVLTDDEYLAQSFRPTRDGALTKVAFTASGLSEWGNSAWVYVQLKTSLNGGQEAVLAESQASSFPSTLGYSEKEFTFPAPVQLLAGQEYFLVLKGDYFYYHPDIIKPIEFINGPFLSSAPAYSRNGGVWGPAGSTMVFKTFIEDLQDVVGPNAGSPPYLLMAGDTDHQVAISVLNHTSELWEYGGTLIGSSEGDVTNDGDYFTFSKGDSYLTIERNVNGAMSNYYDQNGWITVRVENLAPLNSSLLTDQFSLTYNRTLTAVTDANGAYSFSSLPDGNYTITFEKPAYATVTTSGTLLPGQTINSGSSIAFAPVITTPSPLASGMIDTPYTQTMAATEGLPPYTWSISTGSLPAGLSLNGITGNITGTPTSIGNNSFTVQVKDSVNTYATKSFTLAITGSASISGTVTDQATGAPVSGVNVTLALTGITSKDPADKVYSCNDSALLISDNTTIAVNDDAKFSCLSGGTVNSMLFKVRNPFGSDSFSISWNGMLGTYYENLAQSFIPASSGNLTKVSFYLPQGISGAYYAAMVGELHLQLKTGLGGDAGTQLAESASIPIESLQAGTPQWVEFVFANPVQVTAGQEYYLEIQGRTGRGASDGSFWWQYQPEAVSWGNGIPYAIGSAYSKQVGFWNNLNHSLAFRTYINNNPDISLDPATDNGTTNMYGIIGEYVRMSVFDRSTSAWKTGGNVVGNPGYLDQDPSMGGYSYRGDDLTIDWTINSGLDSYYEQNGWLMVRIDNYDAYWDTEPPFTSLVTDQFKISFNRTLTAVTDANGVYSFPALPDGNYSVVFNKAPNNTEIATGVLQSGQVISINPALTVNTGVRIDTNTLAVSAVDRSYDQVIVAGGGRAPYRWSIIGGPLPDGLTLDSNTGQISGRSHTAGDSIVIVRVQDANNETAAKTFTIRVTQTYVPERISVSPSDVSFGGAITGKMLAKVVTVTNTSSADLAIGQVSRPSEPFQLTIDNCSGKTLAAAATCTMTIQFSPMHTGSYYDIIDIPSNDATYPNVSLFLSGDGIFSYLLPDTGKGELVRNPFNFALNSENSATDGNTRLMWQRTGSAAAMTWSDADAYCQNLTLDGYNDWRLPSFLELTTIVNYGAVNPAIDTTVFPATHPDNYWTAFEGTGHIDSQPEIYAGVVNFAYGEAHSQEKVTPAFVRCARGETLTNTLHATGEAGAEYPYTNGLISTDQSTGLVWAGNPITAGFDPYICDPFGNCTTLSESNACSVLTYAGSQNWRTPTIKELATLSNQPCFQDSCFTLSATSSNRPDASGNLTNSYMFSPGSDIISVPPSTSHGVSCVRGGNSFNVTSIGDTGNIGMIEISGDFAATSQPRQAIAQEYIRTHGDNFDFLVFLSTFDYALPNGAQGLYTPVKNDTLGINSPLSDNSSQYGSNGILQGIIDLGNVTALAAAPFGQKLDQALIILGHELNHRFGSFVRYKNPDGSLNTALLGEDDSHWSYLLDSKGSLMYGNGWKDNGDGTFTSVAKQSGYSPLDLYLMGMIPKEQVPPMLLIDNPAIDKTKLPNLGDTITGTAKTVTMDDIIAAEGERIPNAATSQKQFNVGFVLLSRAGDNTTAATQAIETLRKAWAGRFAELTQGKGSIANIPVSLEIAVDSPADGATITGPDVTFSGTVINTSGAETGIAINGIPATVTGNRFVANHVSLIEGANSIEVKATDANGFTSTTTRSVTATTGNYIRIRSNIESGVAPLNISIWLDSSFSIADPTVTITGPVPIILAQGASSTEYTATLPVEGTYTFTATATGPDGKTYTDLVTIAVQNQAKIDNLLRSKWNNINTYLSSGNLTKALSFFTASSKDKYSAIFNQIVSTMPSILATFTEFRTMDIEDGIARYKLIVNEVGKLYAYDIEFLKDETNGLWLLNSY